LSDTVRKRFGETAGLVAEQQDRRTAATQERLRHLLTLTGEERALDIGTGAGALAIALAPLVREVIGVDIVPELVEEGRKRAPANVELVEADATALPYGRGSFDLVCTAPHAAPRPAAGARARRDEPAAAAGRHDARCRPARPRRLARRNRA
jgi:ubiquinone/menaquinone biosynthesis C-methylase UbiE